MSNLPSAYIAFQGGGALGMAHLGAWQEVSQQFNIIGTAGTSAGSIVSALCAAKFHPVHAIDLFHQLNWSDFVNRQSLLKLVTGQDAYSDGKRFHEWLRDQLGKYVPGKPCDITFADLYQFSEIYLAIIACDLNCPKGYPVVFDKNTEPNANISFAVRASISIPGLFTTMSRLDRRQELVDGGVLLNFPVPPLYKQAKDSNCPLVGVRFKEPRQYLDSPNIIEALKGSVYQMMRPGSFPPDNIAQDPNYIDIEIDVSGFNGLDFNLRPEQKKELVKRGAEAAERALDKYKLRIDGKYAAVVLTEEVVKLEKTSERVKSALKSQSDPDVIPHLQEALDWLSTNPETLAKKAGNEALKQFPEVKENEKTIARFHYEIEKYLRFIHQSLTTGKNILKKLPEQSLPDPIVYSEALKVVKNRMREDEELNPVARQKIEEHIDYLNKQIQ
ncbi:patatin-like phospholipase family protein [Microcoleus sp. T3_D1]|uniref:patatin-like phospholipase family protein n=1 Tax=Microcoleus sp. T3_D1 TaxID=3055427 RepID=UPI002FD17F58